MSIVYDPAKLLKKIAPPKKIERIVRDNLGVNRAALSFVDDIEFLNKKSVLEVALKVAASYKARVKSERADSGGAAASELREEIADDPKLMINRVQNEVVQQVAGKIKDKYAGEFYIWLPSSADEPDPEHQLNYGEKFQLGVGEMPGDRYGCQCGMEILTEDDSLDL